MECVRMKIKDFAKTGSGATPKSSVRDFYEGGSIPWINSGELNSPYIYKAQNFITELGYNNSSTKMYPPNTVLVAMYGATAGKASVLEIEACTNQAICAILPDENLVDPYFLKYKLDTLYEYLVGISTGSARDNLSQVGIANLELDIPPLSVQKNIVSVLNTLDRKISLNRSINAELERMAKEIYDYWFVQFEFPRSVSGESGLPELSRTDDGNGQSHFPDANGRPYKSSGGAMVYNPVLKREVPEGWEVKDLSKICKTKLGGTPDTSREEFWNGEFQWLNSGEVAKFPIVESEKSITQEGIDGSATSFLKAGSITLSITRHLRPSILAIDACINQSVVGIEENDIFKKSFIYPYLSREIPRLMTLRVGAQQPHINKETIDVSSIVIPPNEILKKYYETVDDIYEAIINNALQNKKLTSLRDELLPLLMTGQVKIK